MTDTALLALFIALVFMAAGFVKGVVGMGLPTFAMGLLSLAMLPAKAAAILIVPSLVTNLWQLLAGSNFAALLRRLAPMMLTLCVGTGIGIGILTGASSSTASAALGAILALYGLVSLLFADSPFPPKQNPGCRPWSAC